MVRSISDSYSKSFSGCLKRTAFRHSLYLKAINLGIRARGVIIEMLVRDPGLGHEVTFVISESEYRNQVWTSADTAQRCGGK